MKYFTDQEIIEALEVAATASEGTTNCDMIHLAIERINQKNRQLDHLRARLSVAANIIGHNTISEAMDYE